MDSALWPMMNFLKGVVQPNYRYGSELLNCTGMALAIAVWHSSSKTSRS